MLSQYAVIGNPIQHSKSPQIHQAFAQQEAATISYERILAEEADFIKTVDNFQLRGGVGLNVTVPFKIMAYQHCVNLNEFAQAAKAVNTISFNQEGQWLGANTDGVGLLRDLKNNLGLTITNKDVLILGAGGASRGILLPLLQEKPNSLCIANRTVSKASDLINEFSTEYSLSACGYEELGSQTFDIIINATSTSLSDQVPPIPFEALAANCFCYDLAYSNADTAFVSWAKQQGINNVSDGLGMLIEQAAESYYIWRGFKPITSSLIHSLRHQG